jgi:hypothetical protein
MRPRRALYASRGYEQRHGAGAASLSGLHPRCAARRTNWRPSSPIATGSSTSRRHRDARTGKPHRSPLTAAPGRYLSPMRQIAFPLSFIVSGVTHTSALINPSRQTQKLTNSHKLTIDRCCVTTSCYIISSLHDLFRSQRDLSHSQMNENRLRCAATHIRDAGSHFAPKRQATSLVRRGRPCR